MEEWFVKDKRLKISKKDLRTTADGVSWLQCKQCEESFRIDDWKDNLYVCQECDYHMYVPPYTRLDFTLDKDSFVEMDKGIGSVDILTFCDRIPYSERIEKAEKSTKLRSAVITGTGTIYNRPVAIGVMNFRFMGGSMGSAVGEKITRVIEKGLKEKTPVIIFSSSGGARMQEGLFSLMQMAKTSAALGLLAKEELPYISVLTHPTTGGTTASFATLGDVIIAEPGALIGFAGPRVIEQTIKQRLPEGFQSSEFLLEKGFVDIICPRLQLRDTINLLLTHLSGNVR
ncbi:acetyl-CoA carboxylase, carboxyltransferase subunit beta [Acidobacteriota bacterium]